jgi:hypothetical protein
VFSRFAYKISISYANFRILNSTSDQWKPEYMTETTYWNPGDAILLRGVWNNLIWYACPVRVVRDTSSLIALFWRAGTHVKLRRETPEQRNFPLWF